MNFIRTASILSLMLALANQLHAQVVSFGEVPVVSTLAGNGQTGNTDGTTTAARFNGPTGVATDASGNIYVSDCYNHRIRKITPDGVVSTFAGRGTPGFADGNGTTAAFNYPMGLTVDASGNVFVADQVNNRIRKITPDGTVSTYAGYGIKGYGEGDADVAFFNYPTGVAVDATGNVFVADQRNHLIRKIATDGTVSTLAGYTAGFSDGTAVIAGYVDATGTAARFNSPYGIATDASGNIYVTDQGNFRVRKITQDGVVTTFAGTGKTGYSNGLATSSAFATMYSITVDAGGDIYIADQSNNRIRKISDGIVSSYAGTGTADFADGSAESAQFYYPFGVATDASKNVFVADYYNMRIRKISRKPQILISFNTIYGTASAQQNLTINAKDLTGSLTLVAPEGYEVSLSATSGYADSITVLPVKGAIAGTVVYIRLAASTSPGTYNGDLLLKSAGAVTQTLPTNGTVTTTTAVEDQTFNDVKIYPNPTTGNLYITGLDNRTDDLTVSLSDLQGTIVLSTNTGSDKIDISGLTPGLYILTLSSGQQVLRQKVIKQ